MLPAEPSWPSKHCRLPATQPAAAAVAAVFAVQANVRIGLQVPVQPLVIITTRFLNRDANNSASQQFSRCGIQISPPKNEAVGRRGVATAGNAPSALAESGTEVEPETATAPHGSLAAIEGDRPSGWVPVPESAEAAEATVEDAAALPPPMALAVPLLTALSEVRSAVLSIA